MNGADNVHSFEICKKKQVIIQSQCFKLLIRTSIHGIANALNILPPQTLHRVKFYL